MEYLKDLNELKDLNLYEMLELQPSATESEIKTAYRKKALQFHPDKNPDNPKATEQFLQLSKIVLVLTDSAARAAYDKLIKVKQHENENDAKRQKLDVHAKDTLESIFERELERLVMEKTTQLTEDLVNRVFARAYVGFLLKPQADEKRPYFYKLKVEWEESGVYNDVNLKSLFSKHGEVNSVVVLEGTKSAFIDYKSKTSAINAKNEVGFPNCPLKVCFFGRISQEAMNSIAQTSASDSNNTLSADKTDDKMAPSASQTCQANEAIIQEKTLQAGKQGN